MKKPSKRFWDRVLQIIIVSLITISLDYLVSVLTYDDTILLGEAIETAASVLFGPAVGFFATLISCSATDLLRSSTVPSNG